MFHYNPGDQIEASLVRDESDALMDPDQRRRVIYVQSLLKHRRGATMQELIGLTGSTAPEVHLALRQILKNGSEVLVDEDQDGKHVFHLFD